MTNWDYQENDAQTSQPQANDPNIRQYIKSLEKRVNEVEAERAAERAAHEKAQLDNTFQSLGVPASVAGLYTGPKDADSAAQWVTDMRSVFGGGQPQAPAAQAAAPQFNQNQYQKFTEAGANSVPDSGIDTAMHAVNNADSVDDIFAAFKGLPGYPS